MAEQLHITKLTKVGDSFGILIPKTIRTAYGWERGDTLVYVFTSENALTLRRLTDKEIVAIKDRARTVDLNTNKVSYDKL
jgi:bifunctional DNA-binding transcriptional regulator/antitoxin component of YhaV-PrlF toxin-antitoxin module